MRYDWSHRVSLVGPDRGVDRTMNQYDLPIIACFLEEHAVCTLHLIGAFHHIVETRPTGRIPISDPEIRDAEFLLRICGHQAIHPHHGQEMMTVFVKPDCIGRYYLRKIRRVPIVKGG